MKRKKKIDWKVSRNYRNTNRKWVKSMKVLLFQLICNLFKMLLTRKIGKKHQILLVSRIKCDLFRTHDVASLKLCQVSTVSATWLRHQFKKLNLYSCLRIREQNQGFYDSFLRHTSIHNPENYIIRKLKKISKKRCQHPFSNLLDPSVGQLI